MAPGHEGPPVTRSVLFSGGSRYSFGWRALGRNVPLTVKARIVRPEVGDLFLMMGL